MSSQSSTLQRTDRPPERNRPTNEQTDAPADETARASQDAGTEVHEGVPTEISQDLVFDALKNSRRRHVLRYLGDADERVTLSDLAEHVAAIENDTTTAALDSAQRKRAYVGLYQCHLPRLDDMGIVEFDQARGHVELGPAASQLDRHLYIDEDADRPWFHHYLGFVAVGALVLSAGVAGGLLTVVAGATLLLGIGAGVTGLAVLQADERRSQ